MKWGTSGAIVIGTTKPENTKEGRTKTLKWCVIVVGVTQIGVIVKNTNGYVLSVVKRGN